MKATRFTANELFAMDKANFPYKTRITPSNAKKLIPDGILPKMGYEKKAVEIPASYTHLGITYQSTNELWVENRSGYFYAKVYYNL